MFGRETNRTAYCTTHLQPRHQRVTLLLRRPRPRRQRHLLGRLGSVRLLLARESNHRPELRVHLGPDVSSPASHHPHSSALSAHCQPLPPHHLDCWSWQRRVTLVSVSLGHTCSAYTRAVQSLPCALTHQRMRLSPPKLEPSHSSPVPTHWNSRARRICRVQGHRAQNTHAGAVVGRDKSVTARMCAAAAASGTASPRGSPDTRFESPRVSSSAMVPSGAPRTTSGVYPCTSCGSRYPSVA